MVVKLLNTLKNKDTWRIFISVLNHAFQASIINLGNMCQQKVN